MKQRAKKLAQVAGMFRFFPSNFAKRARISTDKELPAKVSKKEDQFTPLSSPMPINFWQEHMTSIWISPGADIGRHKVILVDAMDISFLKKSFYSPTLQLVVIFSKADVAVFPVWKSYLCICWALVAVGDWTFLFFSLSSNQIPISKFLGSLRCFVRNLPVYSFYNLANFFRHCPPTIGRNRICQLFPLM
jgi:hypothetical protein